MQVIAPQLTVPLTFDDLRALPQFREGDRRTSDRFKKKRFIPSTSREGPLIRARLLRLAEQEHLLLISMHQVIGDGWSLGVFVEELVALYDAFSAGEESPLAPLPIQYADFAHWQRHWPSHPEIVAQLEYWREQLRDPLPVMQLARVRSETDNRRSPHRAASVGAAGEPGGSRQTLQP